MLDKKFCELLRAERQMAGKTLGDLARALNVSLTYLSDVERGTRPPLAPDRIRAACAFLGTPITTAVVLHKLAASQSRAYELTVPASEKGQQFGAALQRGWDKIDDETYDELLGVLNKKKGAL